MDLYETWKKMEASQLQKPINLGDIKKPEDFYSQHPALKLQHSLKISMGFAVTLMLFVALLIPLFAPWPIRLLLLLVAVGYLFFLAVNYRTWRQVKTTLQEAMVNNVRSALRQVHHTIYRSIRFQERAALLLYPVSIVAGFMAGVFLANPSAFPEEMQSRDSQILMLTCLVLLTPLTWLAARWLYKISYDKYLTELNLLADELER